ncbi:MAG: T9SS type A sorting domain-containing protein [Bacteroidia bacterium]|nr:T9SS type A sorting domain-containing protein [Bacteroidia bacterium]
MKHFIFKNLFRAVLAITFALSFSLARADHFAGGSITYRCLGGNQYVVTMVIYRDCSPGTLALWPQQDVHIKNLDNSTTSTVTLSRISLDTLNVGNPTLCVLTSVCMEEHIFRTTVTLNTNTNGYDLYFYDSYRNNGITNIANSGSTFFGFTTTVPPTSICNESAKFVDGFPDILCINTNQCIDLSATDADGDVLVYRLVESEHATYVSPFGASNVMNGNPSLAIDANTGIACVTPTQAGQFIITVEVDEVRNGNVISTVRKDLQFFVVNCIPNPVACFTVDPSPASCHDVIIDVSCSANESSITWTIEELDANNNPTGNTFTQSLSGGSLTTINLTAAAGASYTIEPGKCYTVTVEASRLCNGNVVSDQVTKTICVKPLVPSFAGPDKTICLGECVSIGIDPCVDVQGPCSYEDYTVVWYDIVPGINGTGFVQSVCPTETTSYYVTYTDADGCTTADWVKVVVEEPLPDLVCEDVDLCVGDVYGYYPEIPLSGNHYDLDFHIDFGNGDVFDYPTQSLKASPTTVYTTPGTYTMRIEVSNSCGTVSCDKTITVHDVEFCCKPDVACFEIPDTICYGDSLWADMTGCSYTTPVWHQWTIAELNGPWDDRVVKATIPGAGIPQNTNLSESWHEFILGKTYAISFDVCVDCNGTIVCNTIYKFVYIEDCCEKPACFDLPEEVCEGESIVLDFGCNILSHVTSYRINIHEGQTNVWWRDYPGELINTDIADSFSFQSGNTYNISVDVRYDCFQNGVWISKVKTVYRSITILPTGVNNHSVSVPCGTLINLNSYLGDCFYGQWEDVSTGLYLVSPLVMVNGSQSYVYRGRNAEGGCCLVNVDVSCTQEAPLEQEQKRNVGEQNPLRSELFEVYPNPSDGVFVVGIQDIQEPGASYTYSVTDAAGRIAVQGSFENSGKSLEIDLSGYSNGVYFLKVGTKGIDKTFSLIKKDE